MHSPASSTDATDESLLLRFAEGDMKAFESLYDRHEMGSWRFIFRSVRDRQVADDLLQDVWFAVARQAAAYQPRAKFRTWLFTMARNRVVDHFRASRDMQSLDAHDDADDQVASAFVAEPVANSGFGPVRQLESKQQALALLEAIETLPQEQREAFLLQAEAGLGVADIAEATGVSFETAKSRLRYARSRLRTLLWEFA
ncbi:MAG TPA: sigma-70 family RNA polymerase sigma factor [Rhodoferax sp.]|nr:sigma-70 family RNA polymerase sigma factor [Rhodoferax sp.]